MVKFYFSTLPKWQGKNKFLNGKMFNSNEKRWQRLFAQQIVRQDYDWQRENSEKWSLWNTAMLIEIEELIFFTAGWKTTGLNCRDRKNTHVSVNNFFHTRISLRKLAILSEIAKNAKSCMYTLLKIFIMNFQVYIESNRKLFFLLCAKNTMALYIYKLIVVCIK